MKVIATDRQENAVSYTIETDREQWQKKLKQTVNNLVKNVSIQGFRKGKVPFSIAEKHVKSQAYEQTINKLLNNIVKEFEETESAISNNNNLIERPVISIVNVDDDHLELKITYDLMPNIKIGDYKNLNLNLNFDLYKEVSDQEVEDEITRLLKRSKKLVDSNHTKLENDDVAVIDFVGKIDGKEFPGGDSKDFELKIGSKRFIDNFEDQLIGMAPKETRVISVNFPSNYHVKEYAGKPAEFTVTLNAIKKEEEYKLDDEFVKSLKIDNVNTVSELKKYLLDNFTKRNKLNFKDAIKKDLVSQISDLTEIDFVPKYTFEEEKKRIYNILEKQTKDEKSSIQKQLKENKLTNDDLNRSIESDALRSLKYVFAVDKIIEDNNIVFTDDEYDKYINDIARLYNTSVDLVRNQLASNEEFIREELQHDKFIDFIIDENLKNIKSKRKSKDKNK